jgi:electron transfer flavoprotein beta subunit
LVNKVEVVPDRHVVRGRREVSGGYEILESPLPAVVSVKTGSNEPRFMDYRIKTWAFEVGRVTLWTQADLDADADFIGTPGSPTAVSGLEQAALRERKRLFLSGSPEEVAQQLAAILL